MLDSIRSDALCTTFITAFLALVLHSAARAQQKRKLPTSADKVQIVAKPGKIDSKGRQQIRLELTIEHGWYLMANPVANKDLESLATKVLLRSEKNVKLREVIHPPGDLKRDDILGDYRIYRGKIAIEVHVHRYKRSPFTLRVWVLAFGSGPCQFPGYVNVPIK